MIRNLSWLLAIVLAGGCASWTPKPPPQISAPPPEGAPGEEPISEPTPEEKSEDPGPAMIDARQTPGPAQEIRGSWVSKAALGAGSANVSRVQMIFDADGDFSGTMLVDVGGKKRFSSLEGTWKQEPGKIIVTFSDGRTQTWSFYWYGGMLILRESGAELRLDRE